MSINPPFRAEHIGSLLRPPALKEVFTKRGKGEISESTYEATLTDVVARAVKMQEEVGLQSITDGEFGRGSWFGFFAPKVKPTTLATPGSARTISMKAASFCRIAWNEML